MVHAREENEDKPRMGTDEDIVPTNKYQRGVIKRFNIESLMTLPGKSQEHHEYPTTYR